MKLRIVICYGVGKELQIAKIPEKTNEFNLASFPHDNEAEKKINEEWGTQFDDDRNKFCSDSISIL